jgi:hypothetical protein
MKTLGTIFYGGLIAITAVLVLLIAVALVFDPAF